MTRIPGPHNCRLRGHEGGAFFNDIAHTLARYYGRVLEHLADAGLIHRTGDRVFTRLVDAEAYLGSAMIIAEIDARPMGLPYNVPLKLTYATGREHLFWHLHHVPLAETAGTWSAASAASVLNREMFMAAYRKF